MLINVLRIAGFGPASGDMPRQTAEQTIEAQSGNQQRVEASSRSGEPFQVSILLYRDLVALDIYWCLYYYIVI